MKRAIERTRRVTTVFLAVFLWIHALLFLNIQLPLIAELAHWFRLASSEAILVVLLIIFSLLTASGFWKLLLSLTYIYFFPFVLMWYVLYGCFRMLRAMGRWFNAQRPQSAGVVVINQTSGAMVTVAEGTEEAKADKPISVTDICRVLLRPVTKFTVLWCILLLVTTHSIILWICLIVVLMHLARTIFWLLKVLFFSETLWEQIGTRMPNGVYQALSALDAVTRDAIPTPQLKQLWRQLNWYKRVVGFLSDEYLLSRWAWVLGAAVFGCAYLYIAFLFSFAYYGICRVGGLRCSWPETLVSSVFIYTPIAEVPKLLAAKILGGIQFSLVVAVGLGTFINLLRRRLKKVQEAAVRINSLFENETYQGKLRLLEEKVSDEKPPSSQST